MAKIRVKRYRPVTEHERAPMNVQVFFRRMGSGAGRKAFVACAVQKTRGTGRDAIGPISPKTRAIGDTCTRAKNPRAAAAGALRKLASIFSKRSGAFAGYSKTNRKSRRTARKSKRS